MRKKILVAVCLLVAGVAQAQVGADFDSVRDRMRGAFLSPLIETLTASEAFGLMNNDGSFSDASSTEVVLIGRMVAITKSYYEGNYLGGSKEDYRYWIYKSLQYWLDNRPTWKWTGSAMVQPRYVGAIALVLYEDMQQDLAGSGYMKDLAQALRSDIIEFNHWCWLQAYAISEGTIDIYYDWGRMGNVGYRLWGLTAIAAFSNTESEMDWVHGIVKDQFSLQINASGSFPVCQTADGSMFQHNGGGAQQYIIGYGRDWWNNVIIYGINTKNTKWALVESECNAMAANILDGWQWMYYKNQGIYSVSGRHGLIKDASPDNGHLASRIPLLRDLWADQSATPLVRDAQLAATYNRVQDYQNAALDSTKYFWNADMMVYSRDGFFVATKMLSNRTAGPETGNGNGKKNFHLGDGSTLILKDGDEYNDARVGWNFKAVPGITAEQKSSSVPLVDWGGNGNSSNNFAGGLSDGKAGLCAFDYIKSHSYVNTFVQKGYFFSNENGFVALGSDLDKAGSGSSVYTTLNQTEWTGTLEYGVNGSTYTLNPGSSNQRTYTTSSAAWFVHEGIGYAVIPQSGSVTLQLFAEPRTGDWNDLDNRYSNGDNQTVNIFQLSINHGTSPQNGKYAYWVVPGVTPTEMSNYMQDLPFEIVANTKEKQAVYWTAEALAQGVHYQSGQTSSFTPDLQVGTDVACIYQIADLEKSLEVWVADPLQSQGDVELEISRELIGSGVDYSAGTQTSTAVLTFPSGLYKGQAEHTVYDETTVIQVLFDEDFETGADLGGWTSISTDGIGGGGFNTNDPDIEWHYVSDGNGKFARMYGNKQVNEDWFVSPAVDMSSARQKLLSFQSASRWGTDEANQLQLLVSMDYSGAHTEQALNSATWVDISDRAVWADTPGPTYDWFLSGNIDVSDFDGTQVYFAFKFTADGSNNATRSWHIDELKLVETSENITLMLENHIFDLELYPNPTQGITYIQYRAEEPSTLKLFDLQGRLLKEMNVAAIGRVQVTLDIADLADGLYHLQIQSRNPDSRTVPLSRKLLKQ